MAKITKVDRKAIDSISVRTQTAKPLQSTAWWKASTQEECSKQMVATAAFLKENQQYRFRQASIFARLYGNLPMYGWVSSNMTRIGQTNALPIDRPTFNLVQSCVDTLVSRITQARPRPVFLTDNGDYKKRSLSKKMNNFISGELYRTKAYELGVEGLRDSAVLGTGSFKIYEGQDKKVAIDRVLPIELLVDPNDAFYGFPRQLYQMKLVDRGVMEEVFKGKASVVDAAAQAYVDSSDSTKSISDQVIVVEGWHLPSGPDANDGRHTIGCDSGCLFDDKDYDKTYFPFSNLHFTQRLFGYWGQSLAEQLMGTQIEVNKLLITTSKAINLVGVPRIFVEDGSKVVKAHFNNEIGAIVTYRGTKPQYEVAPCMPVEVYQQLQRLIDYGYQQSGISALSAAAKKPAGLNAGVALREYDDLQSDRFAALEKRYDNLYIDMTYKIIDTAKDIADRDGEYATVYPNKNSALEIDLPEVDLLKDPYVIQCHDSSSLPKDPAGRKQEIVDMMQAGLMTQQEGRRLLDFPDLEQTEILANASEERILKILDAIVENSEYESPDPFMDLQLADTITTQYINLYSASGLEEDKAEMLRNFSSQVKAIIQAATPPPITMPGQDQLGVSPIGVPEQPPVTPLLPVSKQAA